MAIKDPIIIIMHPNHNTLIAGKTIAFSTINSVFASGLSITLTSTLPEAGSNLVNKNRRFNFSKTDKSLHSCGRRFKAMVWFRRDGYDFNYRRDILPSQHPPL